MKLASWNVNGIRSCLKNGFEEWLASEQVDIACLQEVKASADILEAMDLHGYDAYWNAAEKPGYSGTALLVRPGIEAVEVVRGMGVPEVDREGRVIRIETPAFTLVNIYAPHSQRELLRLGFKLDFCAKVNGFLQDLRTKGKPLLVTGDLNVAHTDIDLANPKSNRKNAGFLPEERAWMDEVLAMGFVDVFRAFEPGPGHYTWWSRRPGVRERNIGWRIDYFLAEQALMPKVQRCVLQPEQHGSDHCPVVLEVAG